jgi:DNA mismatch repair protein MutL
MMYAYLNAAIKHSLARYNIAPSLDFSLNSEITHLSSVQLPNGGKEIDSVEKGYLYNTFSQGNQAHVVERSDALRHWKDLYQIAQKIDQPTDVSAPTPYSQQPSLHQDSSPAPDISQNVLLVQGAIMVTTVKSGLMIIHIRRAQERIWYERLLEGWNNHQTPSQRLLFPISYELSSQDSLLLNEVLPDLARIGFDIAPFGKNTFAVQGIPTALPAGEEKNVLDEVIDQLKNEAPDAVSQRADRLLIQLAKRLSINKEALQHNEGQQALIDELFACSQPEYTPGGKRVFTLMKKEALDDLLK